jgi:hypothetical protein
MLRGEFNMSSAIFLSDTGDVQSLGAYRICRWARSVVYSLEVGVCHVPLGA